MSAAETPSADPMDLAIRAALRGVRGANPLVARKARSDALGPPRTLTRCADAPTPPLPTYAP